MRHFWGVTLTDDVRVRFGVDGTHFWKEISKIFKKRRRDPLDHWFFNIRDPLSTVFENTRGLWKCFWNNKDPQTTFFRYGGSSYTCFINNKDPLPTTFSKQRTPRQLFFEITRTPLMQIWRANSWFLFL